MTGILSEVLKGRCVDRFLTDLLTHVDMYNMMLKVLKDFWRHDNRYNVRSVEIYVDTCFMMFEVLTDILTHVQVMSELLTDMLTAVHTAQ